MEPDCTVFDRSVFLRVLRSLPLVTVQTPPESMASLRTVRAPTPDTPRTRDRDEEAAGPPEEPAKGKRPKARGGKTKGAAKENTKDAATVHPWRQKKSPTHGADKTPEVGPKDGKEKQPGQSGEVDSMETTPDAAFLLPPLIASVPEDLQAKSSPAVVELLAMMSDSETDSDEEEAEDEQRPPFSQFQALHIASVPTPQTNMSQAEAAGMPVGEGAVESLLTGLHVAKPMPPPPLQTLAGPWKDSLGNLIDVRSVPYPSVTLISDHGPKELSFSQDKWGRLWCGNFVLHEVGYNDFAPEPASIAWRTTTWQTSVWQRTGPPPPAVPISWQGKGGKGSTWHGGKGNWKGKDGRRKSSQNGAWNGYANGA